MKTLTPFMISGANALPLVEGGKGIAVSSGLSAGAWAASGGVGTFSGVNADFYDESGTLVSQVYKGKTRRERHDELVAFGIKGGITQARIAHETASGRGRLHMNVLWEMGGCEPILEGVLAGAKGLVHGVTCGAGMPYRLAEIAANHEIFTYPIVSSARAFNALWKRSFHKYPEWLGGVVYEDPWLAGGHNGLSTVEDPRKPEAPYARVKALRDQMTAFGLATTPIIMAGGVWWLEEWSDWIDNPELGPIAFQFGTRPLLTQESPISTQWKQRLLAIEEGDVYLNQFSPTGFYSSGVRNAFLNELVERSQRQLAYTTEPIGDHCAEFLVGARGRKIFMTVADREKAKLWLEAGYTQSMRTPDSTMVFVTPSKSQEILRDQIDCMGCLSACRFSNWSQKEPFNTGKKADPRSFCIQKTLKEIAHGGNVEHHLMFAGHNAYRFGKDPFYRDGFIPTVRELVDRIQTGK
jgi:nitronate monooxygenase